jgi:hypothetical protein
LDKINFLVVLAKEKKKITLAAKEVDIIKEKDISFANAKNYQEKN